jgi:flagellar biosynthesis/type III secretory pathway protein FliH
MANFEKIFKKLEKKFDKALDKSFDVGWNEGYDSGHKVGFDSGRTEGFEEGVAAHKAHVQSRLKASEELSLSVGKGAEAVRMREMAEFLAWEYDPEEAERQAKIADENGF